MICLLVHALLLMLKQNLLRFPYAQQNTDPCEGNYDETEKCHLKGGVAVCESRQGLCWAWGGEHYHTFDGLNYNFEGTCTYLLAASKGAACGLTPFSVAKKNYCNGSRVVSSTQEVIVKAYEFIIKLSSEKGIIHVSKCQFLNDKSAQVLLLLLLLMSLFIFRLMVTWLIFLLICCGVRSRSLTRKTKLY